MFVTASAIKAGITDQTPVPFAVLVTAWNASLGEAKSTSWLFRHHAPPPDLLTLLQHFLI